MASITSPRTASQFLHMSGTDLRQNEIVGEYKVAVKLQQRVGAMTRVGHIDRRLSRQLTDEFSVSRFGLRTAVGIEPAYDSYATLSASCASDFCTRDSSANALQSAVSSRHCLTLAYNGANE